MYICPSCEKDTISWKTKYLVGFWFTTHCLNCNAKLTAMPIPLALFQILYVWNVGWFSGIYWFTREPINFVYMTILWIILDILNVKYIPLSVMRRNNSK